MRPRVAHVISTRGMGGAERFLAALATTGAARGYEQVVLNPFAAEGSPIGPLCRPVPCAAQPCDRLVEVPRVRHWLDERLRRFRPHIVHAMLFQATVLTASLRRCEGASYLLTHVYGDQFKTSGRNLLARQADRRAGARFDHVVAISESVRQFLLSDYGYSPEKVTRIRLGWHGEPLPPSTSPRPPTVVCVAALRPEKGHGVLLSAIALVRRHVPTVRLVLVGQGEQRPVLEAQAEAEGISDNIEFLGSVESIWTHLADADVFAIASRSEAYGIAIAEAMAAGLPVVAPAVGAIPELVQPGVTGELFPAGDHEAMARHLVRLLSSPQLRASMGRAALAVAQDLRWETAVDRYFEVYGALLEPNAGRHDSA